MPCCQISDRAQMSKTIIAVRHFALGGRESLETAVMDEIASVSRKIHQCDFPLFKMIPEWCFYRSGFCITYFAM